MQPSWESPKTRDNGEKNMLKYRKEEGMLIINGKLITFQKENRVLDDQALLIQDSIISDIGPQAELVRQNPQQEIFDAKGQYVMPGNICGHTHFYGTFSRGMAIPGDAPKDFPEILNKLWWPLDKSLVAEDIEYSALICIIDAIKHGTTTLVDHHASQCCIEGSLDRIYDAVVKTGIRSVLCYEVSDRDGKDKAESGIRENLRMIDQLGKGKPSYDRIAATFGLHASMTLSDETLAKCRRACPDNKGFHIHVAEHPSDEIDSMAKSGTRIIDRLNSFQMLGPLTIVAHAVHVDALEISILADTNTWVTHQPRSNMNNAVGVAPVESMMRAGVKVAMGNDGFSNTMWEEWKTAYLVHKLWNHDPRRMGGNDVINMGVYNTAALVNVFFPGSPVGVLEKNARADIIMVDYQPCTPLTSGNLPWHILFGFNESMVTSTIVAGKMLMKDRVLLAIDEEEVASKARELATKAWERYNRQ
jgi:putative selenium metabolism protein SsnA